VKWDLSSATHTHSEEENSDTNFKWQQIETFKKIWAKHSWHADGIVALPLTKNGEW